MGTSSDDAGDREGEASPRPAGLSILIVAAIVIVVAVTVAAVIAATADEPKYEAGSPEAALQGYLDALIDGDVSRAYGYLSEELRDQCSLADLRDGAWQAEGVRVTLDSSEVGNGVAKYTVTIASSDSGLFGEDAGYEEFFTLTNTSGTWLLTERPWPIYFCSEDR